MNDYPKISVRMPAEMLDALRAIARREGHTLGYLIREAVAEYLEKNPA